MIRKAITIEVHKVRLASHTLREKLSAFVDSQLIQKQMSFYEKRMKNS